MRRLNGWNDSNDRSKGVGGRYPRVINTKNKRQMKKVIILALVLTSCTDQQKAKSFGGNQTITLDKGRRLKNITWKEDNLWILTKEDTSKPTSIYHFTESSSLGVFEGEVKIIEQ
jgi:hypothetical protein